MRGKWIESVPVLELDGVEMSSLVRGKWIERGLQGADQRQGIVFPREREVD